MGRRFHALVLVVVSVALVAPAVARADTNRMWIRPVDGALAKSFDPPRSRFGVGHLGIDFAAKAGTPVRAAGPGTVSFAGSVAGARHVVILHAGNLRTSYSFLASVGVRRGASVVAGEIIGASGATGGGHNGSVLHFGLRSGDTYLDPMALFATVDLTEIVHLAPTADPPRPQPSGNERRSLLAGLTHGVRVVIDAAGHVVGGVGSAAEQALVARFPFAGTVARGTAEWVAQQRNCDAHAPPAEGEGGSGHRVMLVAGIDSSYDGTKPPLALPAAKLGYQPSEVTYFSYAAGGRYTNKDTEGPLMFAVGKLATQLRAMQRREPGREVDLLAHSQGGVVVEAFLALVYKRGDGSYPPLGTVVTLSSPLTGDPIASALSGIARTRAGAAVVGGVTKVSEKLGTKLPLGSAAAGDLAASSEVMRRLDAARFPDLVELTTIGAATDVVVPGSVATRPGARHITVIPHGINAHTAVLNDGFALRVVRSALENKPMPCQSFSTALTSKLVSTTIRALETRAGQFGEAVGRVAEGKL